MVGWLGCVMGGGSGVWMCGSIDSIDRMTGRRRRERRRRCQHTRTYLVHVRQQWAHCVLWRACRACVSCRVVSGMSESVSQSVQHPTHRSISHHTDRRTRAGAGRRSRSSRGQWGQPGRRPPRTRLMPWGWGCVCGAACGGVLAGWRSPLPPPPSAAATYACA